MATNDMKRQFDEIVAGLTADYPSLAGRRPHPRWVVVTAAVVAGVTWGLLSVAMVAWGVLGVATTCLVVVAAATGIALDSRRRRGGRYRTGKLGLGLWVLLGHRRLRARRSPS
ncbi:hypothetical protein ODJ79_37440 [Actinoplanes sp. KI2]|uniref:hypothetical protein n=1 Tax=Actinoplanes sp. KI2 TaxID=2983315 RepID=UPI0021D6004D|nr:hypothetical protein [Actinoplanes sp. KI2]MCU7729433.1 hypothetical protein [Actinoplanes sp. KI2]